MPDDTYSHGHHESVVRSHSWRTVDNSAAYLAPHLEKGQRILDVGCGPGSITADLARIVGPTGQVLGIDRSDDVIAMATDALAPHPHAEARVGDIYALDLDDDAFDVVHAHQVLQHLSDPVAALREMRRVCRPGGIVAVRDADYAAFTWAPANPAITDWLDLYRDVARSNDAEPDAGRHLHGWARAAGFVEVQCSAAAWCFASDDERAWWGGQWAERMQSSAVAHQALERGLATQGRLDTISAGWTDWIDEPGGWFAVLQGEILATA